MDTLSKAAFLHRDLVLWNRKASPILPSDDTADGDRAAQNWLASCLPTNSERIEDLRASRVFSWAQAVSCCQAGMCRAGTQIVCRPGLLKEMLEAWPFFRRRWTTGDGALEVRHGIAALYSTLVETAVWPTDFRAIRDTWMVTQESLLAVTKPNQTLERHPALDASIRCDCLI